MGFEWHKREDEEFAGGSPRWGLIIVLVAVLILVVALTSCKAPKPTPGTPAEHPVQTVTSPVPTTPAPTHRSEPKETKIYVVATGVPYYWSVKGTIVDWNLADRYADFILAETCPQLVPCVHVKMGKFPNTTAAETSFMDDYDSINVVLNNSIHNDWVAHSTLCHEFGHVLGLPHITGTVNTCMTPLDGFYRTRPSVIDTRLVNSFGEWEFEKMYELSGKDIDIRSQPK